MMDSFAPNREAFLLCCDATGSGGMVRLSEEDIALLQRRLSDLRTEHRDLDDVISRLSEQLPADQLQIQRLKKRKLRLKDEISSIESKLLPDIIA
jgi:hypothetical protein